MDAQTFNERDYLLANPDVEAAVHSGAIASGLEHFTAWGKFENRPLRPRQAILLNALDPASCRGVEIGALCRPLVRRADGPIWYVDYADTDFLRNRYRDDPSVNVDEIVDVDAIWGEKTLKQALSPHENFDYVIASHVVEHVPDVVTWLMEIREVLASTGSLRLIVPDKRYCFDILRRETSLAEVLDAYVQRARAPLPRMVLDFCLNAREIAVADAWSGAYDAGALRRMYTPDDAMGIAASAHRGDYHDVHCSVFTPTSFLALCQTLAEIGLVRYRCDMFETTQTGGMEFYVGLQPSEDQDAIQRSWAEALRQAK